MLILGIETATPWGSIALFENDAAIFELSLKAGKGAGEYLLSLLGGYMKKTGYLLADVDLIAVGTGPGSYTGIRVGLAAVKGLAEGIQKPVFGISTLRIIAENARYAPVDFIVSVMDARREEVYAAIYRTKDNQIQELESPQVMAVSDLAHRLPEISGWQSPKGYKSVMICGDGSKLYQPKWEQHSIIIGPPDWDRPLAGKAAQIAFQEWVPDRQYPIEDLQPCYLRRVEAEIRLEERLHAINNDSHGG